MCAVKRLVGAFETESTERRLNLRHLTNYFRRSVTCA